MIKIYDSNGIEQPLKWAFDKYNVKLTIVAKSKDHWEVVALHEQIGNTSMTVRLVGDIIYGIPVAFHWPDAPIASHPTEPKPVKVVQRTNNIGRTGFGMGRGAFYCPSEGEQGPHAIWISDYPDYTSDLVDSLGMIAGTNHAHLEPTFQFVKGEVELELEPNCEKYISALERIREIVESVSPQ